MKRLRTQLECSLPKAGRARMFVRLCGLMRVTCADGRVVEIKSTKGQALLALICLAPDGQISRREAARYLWPDPDGTGSKAPAGGTSVSDEPRLKNLREELKKLRAAFEAVGMDILQAKRETLAVDLQRVSTDNREQLLSILSGAAPSYIKDCEGSRLLAGFKPLGTAFDEWLEERRREFRGLKRSVLAFRARELDRLELSHDGMIEQLRALFDYDPSEEPICRKLMNLLIETGCFGEARRIFQQCKAAVERELEASVEPETEALWNVAARNGVSGSGKPTIAAARLPHLGATRGLDADRSSPAPSGAPIIIPDDMITVGLRPLRNLTGNPQFEPLAVSLYDELLTDLPMLIGPFSILPLPPHRTPAYDAEKSCRFIVEVGLKCGRTNGGDILRSNIQVYDTRIGRLSRSSRAEADSADVLADPRQLSGRIASRIFVALVTEQTEQLSSADGRAHSIPELVLLGIKRLHSDKTASNLVKAGEYFETALKLQKNNVEALIGLAHVQHRFATQPSSTNAPQIAVRKGRAYIQSALDIDPTHPKATYVSAMLSSAEGEPERAAASFDRLLELTTFGSALSYRGFNMIFLDRPRDGLVDIRRSLSHTQDTPGHTIWLFFRGVAHLHCGEIELAVAAFRQSLDIDPRYTSARIWLAASLQLSGRKAEARSLIEGFRRENPDYTLSHFDMTWGSARTRNDAYLSRTRPIAGALRTLGLPER